jgi:exopolyphosphatase/guanosine-5'-triphosphate,3'-diphosphate pyrophosphatase
MSTGTRSMGERESARAVDPVAVIDIGTTSIRMAVAEIRPDGSVRTLEKLSQAVQLGKDAFTRGQISKATIEECVRVLKSYRQALHEFRITRPEQIRVVATSAIREALNRLAFIDRIYIATGLQVEPLDEAEVNRLTYLGVLPLVQGDPQLAASKVLVAEVGGGSTELLVLRQNNVMLSHTFRLGSLRLREMLAAYQAPAVKQRQIMESQIQKTVEQIREHVVMDGPIELLALGGDMRFAASQLTRDANPDSLLRLPLPALEKFTDLVLEASEDQLIRKYHMSGPDAETLGPALLACVLLAREFQLTSVVVAPVTLRDGLLKEMVTHDTWTEDFSGQIVRSAVDLGRKFSFDEPHARHVAELSRQLFDQLRDEHGLEPRHRLILYLAALLHEIGLFVSHRSSHKHAMYLIQNSELFGVSRRDQLLVALVARYHRRALPKPEHEGYATLDRDGRVAVSKLAALLRVAVALDESRSQRVHEIRCFRDGGRLVIAARDLEDLSLEQLALRQNGSLFEETFGMPVLLRRERTR